MVTKEQVKAIANLSKLYLTEEELATGEKEISSMIHFVDSMNSIEKFAEVSDVHDDICNAFHEDEIVPSYPREEILSNVGGGKDGFFYLSKSK